MDDLGGLFVYLCAALFVPIILARYVVRAQWRTVGYACAIWYGFLLLAFGAFAGGDGLGWAMIFAMFYSIPAVPIIALLFRIWNWLRRRRVDADSN